MQIPGLHRPSVSRTLFRTDKASLCLERRQRRVMRLIISYPSRASALHTYHYLAMIYRVWSPRSFFMSLQISLYLSQYNSPADQLTAHTDRQKTDWNSVFGQQLALSCQLWVLLVCCDLHQLHPIWIYNYHHCHPAARIIHCGPQTPHNENLHISPFWVITVFMYFCDKKFYGCRHHLVQLVLSVNSHNHFPSRLYLRSSCQLSALFSSQEFSVTWDIEKVQ